MSDALNARFPCQRAATSGNGNACDLRGQGREHTLYITGSAGISAGAVQLETAPSPDYTGTWAALGSPVTAVASSVAVAQVTGCFGALRARISTTVVGGTVDVDLFSN